MLKNVVVRMLLLENYRYDVLPFCPTQVGCITILEQLQNSKIKCKHEQKNTKYCQVYIYTSLKWQLINHMQISKV